MYNNDICRTLFKMSDTCASLLASAVTRWAAIAVEKMGNTSAER
jgi:hypothetical protein